jgi:hypothetical protein
LEKDTNEILKQINETLLKINLRQEEEEKFSETNRLLQKSDSRVENSFQQIQNSFDRIHDKVFNFNNVLIGVYLVIGALESSKLKIWSVIFPILNLVFLVYLDYRQMEIHRFASREQEWTLKENAEYGRKIQNQTLLSLLALVLSIGSLGYLINSLF